jgi:hypothetical protein
VLAEVGAPEPVTVMDQISRLAVPWCDFDQQPPDPSRGRIGGYVAVDKLATPMTDEEDDEERLEGQGLDDDEVGGPDRLSLVGKEGAPALPGRSRIATPAVAADRARTDDDPELEEFAADTLGAQSGFSLAMVALRPSTGPAPIEPSDSDCGPCLGQFCEARRGNARRPAARLTSSSHIEDSGSRSDS